MANSYIDSYTQEAIEKVRYHPRGIKMVTVFLPVRMVADVMQCCVNERRTIGKMVTLLLDEALAARGMNENENR